MNAGRELDALIAEKVMGWIYKPDVYGDVYMTTDDWHALVGASLNEWYPSTRIQDAWQVVEKIKGMVEGTFTLCWIGHWAAGWDDYGSMFMAGSKTGYADTAPIAICLAALKAVER